MSGFDKHLKVFTLFGLGKSYLSNPDLSELTQSLQLDYTFLFLECPFKKIASDILLTINHIIT